MRGHCIGGGIDTCTYRMLVVKHLCEQQGCTRHQFFCMLLLLLSHRNNFRVVFLVVLTGSRYSSPIGWRSKLKSFKSIIV